MAFFLVLIIELCSLAITLAQGPALAHVQNATFNDTYGYLNPSQVRSLAQAANLSADRIDAVEIAVNFERSNWAGSSTQLDPFYDVSSNASGAEAGSVLKVQQYVNTTYYTLAPNLALSRFQFTTKNLNDTVIPASAYVLWPWMPRKFPQVKGFPVVGWAHGTSGQSGECGPSHIRNLWYQYNAPFTLALQDYTVVAPDYAGLGVSIDNNGQTIPHQYFASPAGGNDLIYAVKAAQKAWPQLSKEFVLMGHSQGGGVAWGAAQNLAKEPMEEYLGTIAGSPTTRLRTIVDAVPLPSLIGSVVARIAPGVSSVFHSFKLSDWLTPLGVTATNLLQTLQGCQSVSLELLQDRGAELIRTDWQNGSYYFNAFDKAIAVGGSIPFAGPMLVLQGLDDDQVPPASVITKVNETCAAQPESKLQVAYLEGVTHVPALYAGQQIWLNWIQERFMGMEVEAGCERNTYSPALDISAYRAQPAYFLERPQYEYTTA